MKHSILLSLLLIISVCAFSQERFYRYYNSQTKKHFYTANFDELGNGANGFVLEGVAGIVFGRPDQAPGLVPVYRFFNRDSGDHYYATRKYVPTENLPGYTMENITCYIFRSRMPGTMPLFEYYNARSADHFYTIDKTELGRGFDGFVLEGIIGFVYPKGTRF